MKKYHFFWGGIYSNWYKSPFSVEIGSERNRMNFNCGEQYMMYCKAALNNDKDSIALIMAEKDPRKQKALGRKVKNFDSSLWDKHKEEVMLIGLTEKFKQNPELLTQLLAEDCETFVEASPHDRIWGIGFDATNAMAHESEWGENLLGKIITQIRNNLKE